MVESHRARRRLDVPILLIAILVATTAFIWIGSRVSAARCRDAGGQMRVSGMDQYCERADGSRVTTAPVLTNAGWGVGVALWLAGTAAAYGGMRAMTRPRT